MTIKIGINGFGRIGRNVLRSAIQNYEERHGLVKEQTPTTLDELRRRLKHVMNPAVGLDIIRTKIVSELSLDDGAVRVVLDLPSDHQFANNIRDEILERIEPIWDIRSVDIVFGRD